jgi:multidrug transporter EmrE-like cation transporter
MLHTPLVSIISVLVASILGASGQFLFKLAASRGGGAPLGFLWTPWATIGLACYIAVMVLFSFAFQRGGTVPVLYPIYATTFIWAAVMAWAIYGQPIRPIHVAGMILLVIGIICMSAGKVEQS